MENELAQYPDWETGGLLLGYSETDQSIRVLEATDGGYDAIRESHEFQYDAKYVEHICGVLAGLYEPELQIVGMWHKHNYASEPPFSRTDEEMHQQLMDIQGHPCLSVLFEKKMDTADACDYDMRMFLLDQKGRHQEVTFNLPDLK